MQTVSFPVWPVWNFQFPERDLKDVVAVKYFDELNNQQTLDEERWRVCVGHNGICALQFLEKHNLPKLFERDDAVTVEYEP
jgi:hypothetical protein